MARTPRQGGPDFSLERAHPGPVCGVDEVGRGPGAGPVLAAAVILDPKAIPDGLDDSKKLLPERREALYEELKHCACIGFGLAEPEEIDRINIYHAGLVAMRRAVAALAVQPALAFIDGNRCPDGLPCEARPIIGGDGKCLSIAAASIAAKVARDRLMVCADRRYPGYGFASHKGYMTAAHREALRRLGPCPIHRFSFGPVREALKARQAAA